MLAKATTDVQSRRLVPSHRPEVCAGTHRSILARFLATFFATSGGWLDAARVFTLDNVPRSSLKQTIHAIVYRIENRRARRSVFRRYEIRKFSLRNAWIFSRSSRARTVLLENKLSITKASQRNLLRNRPYNCPALSTLIDFDLIIDENRPKFAIVRHANRNHDAVGARVQRNGPEFFWNISRERRINAFIFSAVRLLQNKIF